MVIYSLFLNLINNKLTTFILSTDSFLNVSDCLLCIDRSNN